MMPVAALLMTALMTAQLTNGQALPPASEAALLAGAKACVGATVDPAGQDSRLAGWPSVVGNEPVKDGGVAKRVAAKDGVHLAVRTGIDGGCVVQARVDNAFDKAKFLADLSAQTGVAIDGTRPKVDLPNGELMIVQVGSDAGRTFVQLVVANPNGKYAKQSKGN